MKISTRVLLLNSDKVDVTAALQNRPDVSLCVISGERYGDLYGPVEHETVTSVQSLDDTIRAAVRLASRAPITHVIAATEKSIPAGGYIRSVLGVPGPGFDASLLVTHKRAMKDALQAAGVPVARYTHAMGAAGLRSAVREFGAAIIKPVFGSMSKDAFAFERVTEFEDALRIGALDEVLAQPMLVEELVDIVHEYHCEAVVRNGITERIRVSRYFEPAKRMPKRYSGGYFLPPGSPAVTAVETLHEATRAALDIRSGVTHFEVLFDGVQLRVGEIALRPGGLGIPRSWEHAFGVDLWEEMVRTQLDEPLVEPDLEPSRIYARTQLPPEAQATDLAAKHPATVEVRKSHVTRTGYDEVHFYADTEEGIVVAASELHRLAGRRESAAVDDFDAHPQIPEEAE